MKRSAANYEETGLLVCGNDVKLQLFVELLPSCLVRQGSAGGTLCSLFTLGRRGATRSERVMWRL